MEFRHLPFDSPLTDYEGQASALHDAYLAHHPGAYKIFRNKHPRFLDPEIKWLSRNAPDSDIAAASLTLDDARLAIARLYDLLDWRSLTEWAEAVARKGDIFRFESAVEAIINGDAAALRALLREDPGLVRARSTRRACFDPPAHRATLLHYVAANGVEGYRQKTPPNAVEVAKILLDAGADPDALAQMYGGDCTTMSMLVSSTHPERAGVQPALVDLLVDYGASVEANGAGNWTSPLLTALVFGMTSAAQTLVRRGAKAGNVAAAAGLGRVDQVREMLPAADAESRHRAFALAAQLGHVEVVKTMLDAGEDPNRLNPPGTHAHATPLHQAVAAGHEAVVRLLVERGADPAIRDTIWNGTPLGWAEHCEQPAIAAYLRSLATTA